MKFVTDRETKPTLLVRSLAERGTGRHNRRLFGVGESVTAFCETDDYVSIVFYLKLRMYQARLRLRATRCVSMRVSSAPPVRWL